MVRAQQGRHNQSSTMPFARQRHARSGATPLLSPSLHPVNVHRRRHLPLGIFEVPSKDVLHSGMDFRMMTT